MPRGRSVTGQYDHRADLYSLGSCLRAGQPLAGPFLPAYPAPITPGDRNQAQYARMNGTPLPRQTTAPPRCGPSLRAALRLRAGGAV